ncbi:hypothetical protein A2U01_0011669 [Trifolium medium]|uniref:Uncharacterized protein n=1 Tax=Trifolium medium TaxID=97028 RepID=A0A392MTA8_9FABA|nr:hypothetical protein [Trifolium medium]
MTAVGSSSGEVVAGSPFRGGRLAAKLISKSFLLFVGSICALCSLWRDLILLFGSAAAGVAPLIDHPMIWLSMVLSCYGFSTRHSYSVLTIVVVRRANGFAGFGVSRARGA